VAGEKVEKIFIESNEKMNEIDLLAVDFSCPLSCTIISVLECQDIDVDKNV
jgi:hypothetical protein